MIMCEAADRNAHPRKIARILTDDVFVAGQLLARDGEWFLEWTARRPLRSLRLNSLDN
jgi:hypothetical protein